MPVLDTDWEAPGAEARARVKADHFWDPRKQVSLAAQPVLRRHLDRFIGKERLVTGEQVWDFAAIYPAGVRWEDAFPVPARMGAPVVDVQDRLISSEF